ncbi:MAG TPA: hypothetical protein VI603_03675 [Saprospiraceae bacterium]|nr:hypothetical protein [Saprospiraceae bacterium]
MIYYITIHWKSPLWIEIQNNMIRKHTSGEYKIYGFLNGINPMYCRFFDVVRSDSSDPRHDVKLDLLAEMVIAESKNDDDWMVFMDGDTFPVAPLDVTLRQYLVQYQLVAIQRLENEGEQHAHPAFCVTTTGFWRSYKPSWRKGYTWKTPQGESMTDVGGELLRVIEQNHIPWKPLQRSNKLNIHPVLFGIYGDLVYHHGMGFRSEEVIRRDYMMYVQPIRRWDGRVLLRLVPQRWKMRVRKSILHPQGRMLRQLFRLYNTLNRHVYAELMADPEQFIASLK